MSLHTIPREFTLPLTDEQKKAIAHIKHSFENHFFRLVRRPLSTPILQVKSDYSTWIEMTPAIVNSYSGPCGGCTFDISMVEVEK